MMTQVILDRAAVQPAAVIFDPAIKRLKKSFPAVRKSFPGIFSVENERNDAAVLGSEFCNVAQVKKQVHGGRLRRVLGGHEADKIRERLFAENGVDRSPAVCHAPSLKQFKMIDRS